MATEAHSPVHARPSVERAQDDPAERQFRRRLRLYQELTVRGGVALVIVAFQLVFPVDPPVVARSIMLLALCGLFLNGPYFLAARNGRAFRAQAYVRMLVDVLLISVRLYFAGGLAAAHFLGVYLLVMIYALLEKPVTPDTLAQSGRDPASARARPLSSPTPALGGLTCRAIRP